jgi:hypothetical protein
VGYPRPKQIAKKSGHRIRKYLRPSGLGGNDDGDDDEAVIAFPLTMEV